ncbi:MAG: hypothetical protein M1837_004689 [Sclerophora amabilis]|nr:MAG: hypothetical protein M1837_004689 [Sclerophora amabilis]
MRNVRIFSGSSHVSLAESICHKLGTVPAKCDLGKFSNGETRVNIGCSIRDQNVFIVSCSSPTVNDNIMELLIMISACTGGSANKITAVMPYFPYSRQSKKKSHRGAITARMLANLLSVAGVHHIITVDLHASQMQGFFGKTVDNLRAEPLIARWIRHHVPRWREAVVVSKNPGGTKRVTSLADALSLSFGIVTTDRRRTIMSASSFLESMDGVSEVAEDVAEVDRAIDTSKGREITNPIDRRRPHNPPHRQPNGNPTSAPDQATAARSRRVISIDTDLDSPTSPPTQDGNGREEDSADEYTDERARDVTTGRLIQGHVVDDDYSPSMTGSMSGSTTTLPMDRLPQSAISEDGQDPMTTSVMSTSSSFFTGAAEHALGGTFDAAASSDEEEQIFRNPDVEQTITLVGNVSEKTVFIVDDMIDKAGTWIAAAETVHKRGNAKTVYCIATHGLFGGDCLEEMEACECIDYIVVTNTVPVPPEKMKASRKLMILDISNLLSEAIRRNHYGESISQLYQNYLD